MNLEMIKITEDQKEMICIGKEIVEKNKEKYNDQLINLGLDTVKGRMPDASENQIKDVFFMTVYHYWAYGATYDEFFYYDFINKNHTEKITYMTFRVRLLYMDHLNKAEDKHLLFNKYETYQLLKEYYKRDVIICRSKDDYDCFLDFVEKHKQFVVKPTDMSGGRGVYKADVSGLNDNQLYEFYSDLLDEAEQNKKKYMRGQESSVVLEELIDQDKSLSIFNPESVNGVRLPTVTVNGEVNFYQPWLKIGRGGNFLTSAVFGTLDAGIDPKTGIIDTPGMNETGEVYEKHPDNGIDIIGFKVPKWKELLALAKECALKLPQFGYIGWDFVLSKKGWCIMEANYSGDFMWQLYRGKGMKKEFEDLIGWKLDKEFWWQ